MRVIALLLLALSSVAATATATIPKNPQYTLFPNGSLLLLGDSPNPQQQQQQLQQTMECCFDRLNTTTTHVVAAVEHEFCYEDQVLQNLLLLEFSRQDRLPFWDFDLSADQLVHLRETPYQILERYPYVTFGQTIDTSKFVPRDELFQVTNYSDNAYACGQFPAAVAVVGDKNECKAKPAPPPPQWEDTYCVTAPMAKSPLVFQTRVTIADTHINMIKGSALVLVTPQEHVAQLKSFPVMHALRYQSQVNFTQHTASSPPPPPLPCHFIDLAAGQTVHIPSYHAYRLVLLDSSAQWTLYRSLNNTRQHARTQSMAALPQLLHQNALREQPVFLGMWALAMWADELFAFKEHAAARPKSPLLQVAKARWGAAPTIIKRGHADDVDDPASLVEEIAESIREECRAMQQVAKDLMLHDRDKFKEELEKSGKEVRALIRASVVGGDGEDAVFYEFAMDLFEIAIDTRFSWMLRDDEPGGPFQSSTPALTASFTAQVVQDYEWYKSVSDVNGEFGAHEIVPGLYLGGIDAAMDAESLGQRHILCVLTVASDHVEFHAPCSSLPPQRFHHHAVIPVYDTEDDVLVAYFQPAFDFIDECLLQQQTAAVLVHCVAGVSRSATIVLAYLMRRERWTLARALEHVQAIRPIACPNDGFRHQLELFEQCDFHADAAVARYMQEMNEDE